MSIDNFDCLKCQKPLQKDRHDEEVDYLDWCISIHEDDEIFYYCDPCRCYYLLCPVCEKKGKHVFCQFLKHSGYRSDNDNQYMRKNGKETLIKNLPDDDPDNECFEPLCYDVTDLNLYYFDITDWLPTGPNGGDPHQWLCNECLTIYCTTDK